jgi:SAM-dependent methyltransferase
MASLAEIAKYWNANPCDVDTPAPVLEDFDRMVAERRRTHPYVESWADFARYRDQRILEIGIGAGLDFHRWAQVSQAAVGVDLTATAVRLTRAHLAARGLTADVREANAEALPFPSGSFDVVYSFGVLHHSENPAKAIQEAVRVVRPGGTVLLMLYQRSSWVTLRTWLEHPWLSPTEALARHKESPGTRAYSVKEVSSMVGPACTSLTITPVLTTYDYWDTPLSPTPLKRALHAVWPRPFVRMCGDRFGWNLLIRGTKGNS